MVSEDFGNNQNVTSDVVVVVFHAIYTNTLTQASKMHRFPNKNLIVMVNS